MPDINQTSAVFANVTPFATQQTLSSRQANQDEQNETQRATANAEAVDSTDTAQTVVAQPDAASTAAVEEEQSVASPVGELSETAQTGADTGERGSVLDISV